MCLMPKMPSMPSAEEVSKQQLEVQRQLQADADSRAADELKEQRRKAMREQIRANRRRRGRSSLITKRDTAGGLLGIGVDPAEAISQDLTSIS